MRKGIGKEKKQATAALKSEGNGFYAPNGSFLQRKSSRSGEWVDSLAEMEAPVHRFSPLQLKLAGAIQSFRSQEILQFNGFSWSEHGDDGVLIGDDKVIKLGGYDQLAVVLDDLGHDFGFQTTNAHVVKAGEDEWPIVLDAVKDLGWDRHGSEVAKTEALVMDRVRGVELQNVEFTLPNDREKIIRLCEGLGRMLVMDLLLRNNDRFSLNGYLEGDDHDHEALLKATPGAEDYDWLGNQGNILVSEVTGEVIPIDSQFTPAADEADYATRVVKILNDEDRLVKEGLEIINGTFYEWSEVEGVPAAFQAGIRRGKRQLWDYLGI